MKDLRTLLVVDLEATCWSAEKGCPQPAGEETEIIEFGITKLDLRTFERSQKTSILVKPTRSKVSTFCTELTTITQDLLDREGVSYKEACARITAEFKAHAHPWCSWGAYDRDMIELEARRRDFEGPATLGWHRSVFPFSRQHTNMKQVLSLLGGRFDGEFGMAHACKVAGIELEGVHHRGDWDSWNIAGIVAWMLKQTRRTFDFGAV